MELHPTYKPYLILGVARVWSQEEIYKPHKLSVSSHMRSRAASWKMSCDHLVIYKPHPWNLVESWGVYGISGEPENLALQGQHLAPELHQVLILLFIVRWPPGCLGWPWTHFTPFIDLGPRILQSQPPELPWACSTVVVH